MILGTIKAILLLQHPAGRAPSSDWSTNIFKKCLSVDAKSKTKKIILQIAIINGSMILGTITIGIH